MTVEQRKKLKLALSLTGSLVVFLFFIIFINTLTRNNADETIRVAAKQVLEHWSGKEVYVTVQTRAPGTGLSFSRVFSASIGSDTALVYVVTITGRSGPYSTVFCVPASGPVEFCGFLLHPERSDTAMELGITPRMIDNWKQKIAALATRSGEYHEE